MASRDVVCPFCFASCSVRVDGDSYEPQACPRCDSYIPEESLTSELFPVAVVGPSRCGKTHFLTVLAHQMVEEVVWPTYWSVTRVVRSSAAEDGGESFDRPSDDDFVNFEEWLYPQRGAGRILGQTERRSSERLPLSLVMHISYETGGQNRRKEPRKKRDLLVALTDTAGEDLLRTGWNDIVNKYPILGSGLAKGLIALVDPAELARVREEIGDTEKDPLAAERYARQGVELKVKATLESVLAIPQIRKRMRNRPLAVCLAKCDALVERRRIDPQDVLASPAGALFRDDGLDGLIDVGAVADISERTEAFLSEMNGRNTISKAASLFKYRAFFAIDALGSAISTAKTVGEDRVIMRSPNPRRVLDPLLYLLWQYGLVGGR